MTCEQIHRCATEIEPGKDTSFWSDAGVAAHVASCIDCTQFKHEQQRLHENLHLLRDCAGPVSESLDAAVVCNYRCYLAEREATPPLRARWVSFPLLWRWGAVAALTLGVAAFGLFSYRKQVKTASAPTQAVPAPAAISKLETAEPQIRPVSRAVPSVRKYSVAYNPDSVRHVVEPIPEEFRGLMYCDELSCNGAMDVIRVQLPSSVIARPVSGFRSSGGAVNADVLIGPDGIARGIRIEEQEF